MAKVEITPAIAIDDSEFEERFVLSSGPGGQNVNKVASAVELRFNPNCLPEQVRMRLVALAGRRATKDGVLVLHGRRFRDQQRNRQDVQQRLFELIRRAATIPKARKPTKPKRAAKEKRLEQKKARSKLKRLRSALE